MSYDEEQRFQLATGSARRLVTQSLAHCKRVSSKMSDRLHAAARTSPYGVDQARVLEGEHDIAFRQIIEHVEATSNALVSHLTGLQRLLSDDTFNPLPAMVVTRSIAEVAASCVWIVSPTSTSNDRMARGYAALFFTLERGIQGAAPDVSAQLKQRREQLIQQLGQQSRHVSVVRRMKDGIEQDDAAQVFVGRARDRRRAKVAFAYSQRVKDEIPRVSQLYSALSGVAHGERTAITTSWNTPDAYARVIGHVATASAEAWSDALHAWVGATAGPFLNEADRQNILRSISEANRAAAIEKFMATVQAR